ncbi:MAG: DUF4325 domain-containing protein [Xanthomonadaceae bacterium]|nr:DUF4325 domain-containing protein [Xanthomonadaceae bacterium]
MPRPDRSAEIDAALLAHVAAHPRDLVRVVGNRLELTRPPVLARIRALVAAGYLEKTGTTRPVYGPGRNRRAHFRHALQGLDEDRVWRTEAAPLLADLPANVRDICHHGLTEMLNNAVDHSEGTRVQVLVDRNDQRVAMAVIDDGVGIFRKIARALDLPDERLALLELHKGKFTTDPRHHSGEGVFFTSRMFDVFAIHSHELVFDHRETALDDWLFDVDRDAPGTAVMMEIALDSKRTAKEVFDRYSGGPDDYTFAKTVVPVRLAKVGDENLVSRSQAKRLMQRVDRFRVVVLDFAEVGSIGQAFADEVFRVFANEHPGVELVPVHANPEVQQMIRRAEVARDADAGQLPLL